MTRERYLELKHFAETRFLEHQELLELFEAVNAMQLEMIEVRRTACKALGALDDPEAAELPLSTLVERLELDCNVEFEQREALEEKLRAVEERLKAAGEDTTDVIVSLRSVVLQVERVSRKLEAP